MFFWERDFVCLKLFSFLLSLLSWEYCFEVCCSRGLLVPQFVLLSRVIYIYLNGPLPYA